MAGNPRTATKPQLETVVDYGVRTPGKRGRSKYTPVRVRAITAAIRAGATITSACQAATITISTYEEWCKQYPDFLDAVQKAEADCIVERVKRIEKAGKRGVWQADAWVLERKFPDQFGQQVAVRIRPDLAELLAQHGLTAQQALELLAQELKADNVPLALPSGESVNDGTE